MGWWFGRILTFELEADPQTVSIGQILNDVGSGAIECSADARLIGYAALGNTIAAAVKPLLDTFDAALVDDGGRLTSPATDDVTAISKSELGCGLDDKRSVSVELTQASAASLPATLALRYYDCGRDYQAGEMRAAAGEGAGRHARVDMPAALEASEAKGLAESALESMWSRRDRLKLRLPPERLRLQPGSLLKTEQVPGIWQVEQMSAVGLTAEVLLRPYSRQGTAIAAEGGRAATALDAVQAPTRLALFDLPDLGSGSSEPSITIAASSAGNVWRPVPVDVSLGGSAAGTVTMSHQSVLGEALSALGAGQSLLIDSEASIDVQLHNADQWLESCTDDDLVAGFNLAVVGDELIQFGAVTALGNGKFRLARLLRGRRGTEWAMGDHGVGEPFALIQGSTFEHVAVAAWHVGGVVAARPRGLADAGAETVQRVIRGEGAKPPSPVRLEARLAADGDLHLSWVRRSRQGWAWTDGMDAPLGETQERYRVTLQAAGAMFEAECTEPSAIIGNAELAALGQGPCAISVAQIGDSAVSAASQISITLD